MIRGIESMINIIGISLGFLGSVISVLDIILSKPTKGKTTWNHIGKLGDKEAKSKKYTVAGLSLIGIGFLLQLISAIMQLN